MTAGLVGPHYGTEGRRVAGTAPRCLDLLVAPPRSGCLSLTANVLGVATVYAATKTGFRPVGYESAASTGWRCRPTTL